MRLCNDVLDDDFGSDKVEIPDIAKSHRAGRESLLGLDLFVYLDPVTLANGIRLEVGKNRVDFQETTQDTLNMLKSSVLTHPTGHILSTLDEVVDLGTDLAWLNRSPKNVTRLIEARPDSGQI